MPELPDVIELENERKQNNLVEVNYTAKKKYKLTYILDSLQKTLEIAKP